MVSSADGRGKRLTGSGPLSSVGKFPSVIAALTLLEILVFELSAFTALITGLEASLRALASNLSLAAVAADRAIARRTRLRNLEGLW